MAVAALVMAGAEAVTLSKRTVEPVPVALVALRVMLNTPAAVGIPEMIPVEGSMLRPDANPLAAKLVGPLAAVIW